MDTKLIRTLEDVLKDVEEQLERNKAIRDDFASGRMTRGNGGKAEDPAASAKEYDKVIARNEETIASIKRLIAER